MTELSSQFFDLLANNVYFRAGFLWALFLVALGWLLLGMLNWLYARWLLIRQFFEPIKKPGKMPVEAGSSPASILLGCLGGILGIILLVGIVIGALFWVGG